MSIKKIPVANQSGWKDLVDQVNTNTTGIATNVSDITTLETNRVTTVKTVVDTSAGGTDEVADIATIPAGSLLLNVTAITTEAFTGDTTTTLEIGKDGNIDAYIDTVDLDVSTLDTQASSLNGTTNDVKTAQYLDAETDIIATWTNTDNADAGEVTVIVTYVTVA